ncbi:hypothetical protein HK100_008862, partial [Physocladia obscura]
MITSRTSKTTDFATDRTNIPDQRDHEYFQADLFEITPKAQNSLSNSRMKRLESPKRSISKRTSSPTAMIASLIEQARNSATEDPLVRKDTKEAPLIAMSNPKASPCQIADGAQNKVDSTRIPPNEFSKHCESSLRNETEFTLGENSAATLRDPFKKTNEFIDVSTTLLPKQPVFNFNNCHFGYSLPTNSESNRKDFVVGMANVQNLSENYGIDLESMEISGGSRSRTCRTDDMIEQEENNSIKYPIGTDLTISDLSTSEAVDSIRCHADPISAFSLQQTIESDFLKPTSLKQRNGNNTASKNTVIDEDSVDERYIRKDNHNHNYTQSHPLVKKREPISFRFQILDITSAKPSEEMLKKKHQELDVINAELVQLSKIIAVSRHNELKRREALLDEKEAHLVKAQNQIEFDVQELLQARISARDGVLKREIEAIILHADASVASLVKENRRLVTSNKVLSGANRRLRDQVRLMMQGINERDIRELELHSQLKQHKERIERLKKSSIDLKPSKLIIELQNVKGHNFADVLAKQKLKGASTQTISEPIKQQKIENNE